MTRYRGALAPPGESLPRPATLEIAHLAIDAELRDGQKFTLPLEGASLELGGENGRTLYCRPRDRKFTVVSDDPEFVAALRASSFGVLDREFDKIETSRKERVRTRGLFYLAAAAVIGVAGLGVWWVPTQGVARIVNTLPVSVDRTLGDRALAEMDPQPEVHRPVLDAALREIVSRLSSQASTRGFSFRVRVVDRADVNAFALPGGAVVVFTGLLRRATRADQVAGVLGHEMAHVTLRHGMQGLVRAAGASVALRLLWGDGGALFDTVTATAMTAVLDGYSRAQESAADAEGVRMVAAAGMDPRGLVELFQMLRDVPGSEMPGVLSWFSDHPGHNERIIVLNDLIPRLRRAPSRPLATDWAAVRAEAGP